MSHIDDLIALHCPDGVPHRPLGEVGEFIRGNGLQKRDLIDSGTGAIHYGQVFTTYGTSTDHTVSFVAPSLAERLRRASPGDLVVATTSENDDDVCKAVAWLGDTEIAVSGDAFIFRHTLDPKYAAYFFQSAHFDAQKRPFINGTKVRRVSGTNLARILVPVPPIEVQREISSILSKMEQLEAELEAELEARRRQYDHLRDSLVAQPAVASGHAVRFGDIAVIVRGASPRPIHAFISDQADGVPWIKIGDTSREGKYVSSTAEKVSPEGAAKSRRVKPGDFLLSNSMSFGRPYISQIEGCIHDGWLAISDFSKTYDADFLYHLLRSAPVYQEMASRAGAGTVKNLNANIVKNLVLPAPPVAEQKRIAKTLDAFDLLLNDLSIGLPAEIAARRQQYEYYRDRLLTFKELAA